MMLFKMLARLNRMARNKIYCIYLGRSKRKITQGTTVRDTLLLEDDQMKTASTSNSTVTAGSSSQTLNIDPNWVRSWEHAAAEYQNTLQLNRHTQDNEKSPLKRESSRTKTETISSLPKYVSATSNSNIYLSIYFRAAFHLTFFRIDISTCNKYQTKRPVRRARR